MYLSILFQYFFNFYPRSPCGERQKSTRQVKQTCRISIHALLAESDIVYAVKLADAMLFLSTLSLRRATACLSACFVGASISIHALLAESDSRPKPLKSRRIVFLSTLSLRRATSYYLHTHRPLKFLSTLSLRRATFCSSDIKKTCKALISIHALLAESDEPTTDRNNKNNIFLSTLSLRRATAKVHKTVGHFCAYETNFMGIASSC